MCLAALRCQYFCRFVNGAWALNGRMCSDTPEVSLCFRDLFGQFGVALKTIYLFGRLRGTLVVTKVLGGFFRLIRKWVRAKVIAAS